MLTLTHLRRCFLFCGAASAALLAAACNAILPQVTPTAPPVSAPGLTVIWVQDADLWMWAGRDARLVVSGDVVRPYLAPDGRRAAFTRGPEGRPGTLWTVDLHGEAVLRRIDTPGLPDQVVWVDGDTLLFNTLEVGTLGTIPNNDLHRADLPAGTVAPLEPGGHFSISQDGRQVIVADAGAYNARTGRLHMVRLDDTAEPGLLLEFPAVATGAHDGFYPAVQWLDDGSARVALPHADAVYQEINGEAPPVTLYALHDTQAEPIGDVPASFFGLPRWSADGSHMLYLERERDPASQMHAVIAAGDGSNPQRVASGEIGALGMPRWLDGERFLYVDSGAYWLASKNQAARRWLETGMGALIEPVTAGEWLVYAALEDTSFEIRAAQPTQPERAPITIAVTGSAPPALDAVMAP